MNVIKLAEITGVSKSTIYRALNGDKIKDSTKQRIIDTINENDINFSFNGFETGYDTKVKLIALVTDTNYRNRAAIEQIKDRFSENGFTVIEIDSEAVKNASEKIEHYLSKNFRSFIFMGFEIEEKCNEFIAAAASDRPVILINSFMTGKNIYCITSNESETISKAVMKLSDDYGHKNFLYCISDKTAFGKKLSQGFEEGIKLSGLRRQSFCSADCISRNTPSEAIASALKSNPSVTAIITQDEATAVAAASAAEKLGLKIPRDITIVGLKGNETALDCNYSIAYIDTKTDMISDMALTLTIAAINGKKASKHIKIPCSFIQKKSVAKSSMVYSHAM